MSKIDSQYFDQQIYAIYRAIWERWGGEAWHVVWEYWRPQTVTRRERNRALEVVGD